MTKIRWFLGIDVGKKGSLCALSTQRHVCFFDWPKDGNLQLYYDTLTENITKMSPQLCILERVHAMPRQGVTSMFTFGVNFGIWQGWLYSWRIPHKLVPPQTWMKGLVSRADGDTKKAVAVSAQRLFPDAQIYGPKGGLLDGRADSLMMACYGMTQHPSGVLL